MDDSWSRQALLLFLKCETVLYRGLSQSVSGLDKFVAVFNSFSRVRKLSGIPRASYLSTIADEGVQQTPGIVHLDLRLGERAFGERAGLSEYDARELYREYFGAYVDYLDGAGNTSIAMTFPLGLIKDHPKMGVHWRWDTTGLWGTIRSYIEVLRDSSAGWKLADGIDVCGAEDTIPNWVITPAVSVLSCHVAELGERVSYRFHAGEWQWNPIHGLRRIVEALNVDMSGFKECRIGHGLALDADDWTRLGDQPIDEVLDDLVFVYSFLSSLQHTQMQWRIEREIRRLVRVCYGAKIADSVVARDTSFIVRAYESRTQLGSLEQISVIRKFGRYYDFIDGYPTAARMSSNELLSSHLGVHCLSTSLGDTPELMSAVSRIRDVLADSYEILQPMVLSRCESANVVVEICPTSNAMIGTFRGLRRHPVRRMLDAGVKVCIGTDDPSIFHSCLSDEYSLLQSTDAMTLAELDSARVVAMDLVTKRSFIDERACAAEALADLA